MNPLQYAESLPESIISVWILAKQPKGSPVAFELRARNHNGKRRWTTYIPNWRGGLSMSAVQKYTVWKAFDPCTLDDY